EAKKPRRSAEDTRIMLHMAEYRLKRGLLSAIERVGASLQKIHDNIYRRVDTGEDDENSEVSSIRWRRDTSLAVARQALGTVKAYWTKTTGLKIREAEEIDGDPEDIKRILSAEVKL
ncbi:unnamed protein product, partial [Amoebophrya sp. A25]